MSKKRTNEELYRREGGVGGVSQKERPPKVTTTKIRIVIRSFLKSLLKRVILSITVLVLTRLLFDCDWGFSLEAAFFAPFLNHLVDFFLSSMDEPLSVRGDGRGASSSKRPQWDLNNVPAAEPESAPPSDPRAVEDENLRLRQENTELKKILLEEVKKIKTVLDEAEKKIEQDHQQKMRKAAELRDLSHTMYNQYKEVCNRTDIQKIKNGRVKDRINQLQFEQDKIRFKRKKESE